MLLEKAYAKIFGSYLAIVLFLSQLWFLIKESGHADEAILYLTGAPSKFLWLNENME